MLEFRWVAALALWTIISGPIFVRLSAVTPPAPSSGWVISTSNAPPLAVQATAQR